MSKTANRNRERQATGGARGEQDLLEGGAGDEAMLLGGLQDGVLVAVQLPGDAPDQALGPHGDQAVASPQHLELVQCSQDVVLAHRIHPLAPPLLPVPAPHIDPLFFPTSTSVNLIPDIHIG